MKKKETVKETSNDVLKEVLKNMTTMSSEQSRQIESYDSLFRNMEELNKRYLGLK